ncbi:hypothetical protein [Psychrosphaera algicola]|uniref:hypothetical protein n=1 Tax=Psychrosphaera algicola TaxID=3023714 RepID=UPI00351D363B
MTGLDRFKRPLRTDKVFVTKAQRLLIKQLASVKTAAEVESRYPESDATFDQTHEHLTPAAKTIEEVQSVDAPVSVPEAEAAPEVKTDVVDTPKAEVDQVEAPITEEPKPAEEVKEPAKTELKAEVVKAETKVETEIVKPKSATIGFASAPMTKPTPVVAGTGESLVAMAIESRPAITVSGRSAGASNATNSATSEATKTL